MARIGVIVPDEMKEQVELLAKEQDRNISWIVKKAIEEYLEKQKEGK